MSQGSQHRMGYDYSYRENPKGLKDMSKNQDSGFSGLLAGVGVRSGGGVCHIQIGQMGRLEEEGIHTYNKSYILLC